MGEYSVSARNGIKKLECYASFKFENNDPAFEPSTRFIGGKKEVAEFEAFRQVGPIVKVVPFSMGKGVVIAVLNDPNYEVIIFFSSKLQRGSSVDRASFERSQVSPGQCNSTDMSSNPGNGIRWWEKILAVHLWNVEICAQFGN